MNETEKKRFKNGGSGVRCMALRSGLYLFIYIISALHTRVHRAAGLTVRLFFRTFFFPAIESRRDV